MSEPTEFARECRAVAATLLGLPSAIKAALAKEVKAKVAEPLASDIRTQAYGPYSRVLRAGTRAITFADPSINIGGDGPTLSGGATPRDLVFGTEWGGGKRITAVPARAGRAGYRRRSTMQFRNKRPFVYPTIEANLPEVLDTYAEIVLDVMEEEVSRG